MLKVYDLRIVIFFFIMLNSLYAAPIQDIQFHNISRISPQIAQETIDFKKGDELDIKKIDNAIKEFFKQGYFNDVWVEDQNGTIHFYFKEKPTIGNLKINGYKTREDDLELLYTSMNLKKGSMYSKKRVDQAKKALLRELEREGYINSVVEIETEDINENSISVTFNVNKGEEIIIKRATYHGASRLSVDDIEEITANKEEDAVSWWFGQNSGELMLEQLEYDSFRIKDKYYQNGYLDADVQKPFMKIDFASNQAELDFFISEGEQYFIGETKIFLDANILDPKTLYPKLSLNRDIVSQGKCMLPAFNFLNEETPFDISKLRKDVDMIKEELGNLGYAFAEVKYDIQKDKKKRIANIMYSVIPGEKVYINDVIISGNNKTLDRAVRRNVYLAPGDLYNGTDFKESKSKLQRTGFFTKAELKKEKVSDTLINILVSVEESPTGSLTLGGGYGSYDGWSINAAVGDKNIFGSGLSLDFSTTHSEKTDKFALTLSNPAIYDSIYNGSVEIHNNRYEVDSTYYDLYKKIRGFTVSSGRAISRNARVGLSYTYDDVFTQYDDVDTTYVDINDYIDQDYIISSVTPYISFNNTDDYYIPRSGIITGASVQFAGHSFGGDAEYNKYSTYLKSFCGLEEMTGIDMILRYKANLKILEDTGNIPQGESFYLGGPRSVRGYESYAFGPDTASDPAYTRYFANTVELSLPLIPSARMRWSLFYDYGMIGIDRFKEIRKIGRGAVIEWYSPVGPLQFIFSRAMNPDPDDETTNFEFNLGGSF